MRRGTDFGAAVDKSQVAATNPTEIVRGKARSFQVMPILYLPLIRRN